MSEAEPATDADHKDTLEEAKRIFAMAEEREADNRRAALDDLRFVRLREQWPESVRKERDEEDRPCMTFDKLGPFVRQVVNTARQNRPQMQVHPVGTGADQETAEVINGILRNIEVISDADAAYDTALEYAVSGGLGYLKVNTRYCDDDTFDQDLIIERVPDPARIWGDPISLAHDSADWNDAFELELLETDDFERQYPKADPVDWKGNYADVDGHWREGDRVGVLKWWHREPVLRTIALLSTGEIVDEEVLTERAEEFAQAEPPVEVVGERVVTSHEVVLRTLTAVEVLDERPWPGKLIPIIPVYGEDIVVEGRRHLTSLIRSAKEPQQAYNYARSAEIEAVALAPKAPFVGPAEAFEAEPEKWANANTTNYAYLAYKPVPNAPNGGKPERQPYAGPPAGWMALASAADGDMKSMLGMFDASMGENAANEQSGKAILALQASGDTSTFHFSDNQARGIRQTARVLVDLIPHVYSGPRTLRVLGADRKPQSVPVNQPTGQPVMGPNGQPQVQTDAAGQPILDPISGQPIAVERIYDLTVGKYDVTVEVGPGFASRREQAANQMLEVVKAYPAAAQVIAPELARNMDWPGAEKLADALGALGQQQAQQGGPQAEQAAALAKMQGEQQLNQQRMEGDQQLAQQQAENEAALARTRMMADIQLKRDQAAEDMKLARERMQNDIALQREKAELEAGLQQQRFAMEAQAHQAPDPVVPGGAVG